MRHLPLALLGLLAACSSDPSPTPDASTPDASGCDDACGAGYDCLGNRCVGEGDIGAVDVGTDAGFDAGAQDVGFDAGQFEASMAEIPGPDSGTPPTDVQLADVTDAGPAEDCLSHLEACFCPDGTSSTHDPCVTEFCSCDGHTGPPDAGFDAGAVDVGVDTGPHDAGVVDAGLADVGFDVGFDAGFDTGPADVGFDVGVDTGVDVPRDTGPRDTGPVDGGPVTYDLNAARSALEVHDVMHSTDPPPGMEMYDCPDDAVAHACSVASGILNFNVSTCGTSLTGRFVLDGSSASDLSIFGGGGGSGPTTLRFASGARSGHHQSFHIQFSGPPFQAEQGFSGPCVEARAALTPQPPLP